MRTTRLAPDSSAWSLLDQALVSASNFGVSVLLARALGIEAFGAYVVAQTYLLYANTFQSSLVVSPMMSAVPAAPDATLQRALLRGFFGYALGVAALTTIAVQVVALMLGRWVEALALGGLALPLAAAMVAFQVQDWMRRALYARDAHRAVFLSDLLAYGGQIIALGWTAWSGRLGPALALWTLATMFALSACLTAFAGRLIPGAKSTLAVVRAHWRDSRNFLASWQLQWIASSGVILVGTGFIGVQAAGAIRAAQNLLGPVNVLFQWMDNVVPVRCARLHVERGHTALATYLRRIHLAGVIALGLVTVLLYGADDWLMELLYGPEYRPFAVLIVFQALYYLFGHSYRMQSYYNRTIGRTGLLARASLWWAAAALGSAVVLVNAFAERGIMAALIIGELVALAYLLSFGSRKGRLPAAAAAQHARLVLPSRAILHLPLANRHVVRGALRLYAPSRWQGRVFRTVLATGAPAWPGFGNLVERAPPDWCPHLAVMLSRIPGADPAWTAGLQSSDGPRAKMTLCVMREDGQALVYVRLGLGAVARRVVANEAKLLDRLGRSVLAEQSPVLMSHGELDAPDGYYLVESAGPDMPLRSTLDTRHFALLGSLLVDGAWQQWESIRQCCENEIWSALEGRGDAQDLRGRISRLLADGPETVPVCIEHGDFAPWNLKQLPDGRAFAIDWEHGRLCGLPWLDALHFRFQWATLVQRCSAAAALRTLLQTFELAVAQPYARLCAVDKHWRHQFTAVYLIRALGVGHAEGREMHFADQQCRLAALHVLLSTEQSHAA